MFFAPGLKGKINFVTGTWAGVGGKMPGLVVESPSRVHHLRYSSSGFKLL